MGATGRQAQARSYEYAGKSPVAKKHPKKHNPNVAREIQQKFVQQQEPDPQFVSTSQTAEEIVKMLKPAESYTNLEAKIELSRQLIQKY